MSAIYPYISGSGPLIQVVEHLKKSFPQSVTAETLKKLNIAPNNESYVINILKFINILDENGNKTEKASKIFVKHSSEEFQKGFSTLVKDSYSALFELHGEDAWELDLEKLISFFRSEDESSSVVGTRQARTFQALSAISGYNEPPITRKGGKVKSKESKEKPSKKKVEAIKEKVITPSTQVNKKIGDFGLTVRIEINLPAQADQATYDKIFKSIRENLINGE